MTGSWIRSISPLSMCNVIHYGRSLKLRGWAVNHEDLRLRPNMDASLRCKATDVETTLFCAATDVLATLFVILWAKTLVVVAALWRATLVVVAVTHAITVKT